MTASTTIAPTRLRSRSREALSALSVAFLLGMILNLLPHGAGVLGSIVLGLHVLVGIGIVVVGVRLLIAARREGIGGNEALWGLIAVAITFIAGVLTIVLHSGWFSFIMAAGFLAAVLLYVRTLLIGATQQMSSAGRPGAGLGS